MAKKRPSRSPATQPGFRKGFKPANAGNHYPPRAFTDPEFMALMYGCSRTSSIGLRDRALLALMYRSGLRISEALALHPDDLRQDEHAILVRNGKGGKRRMAYMDAYGWEQMTLWLERRATVPGVKPGDGFVFCTVSEPTAGNPVGSPAIRMMMKRKGEQAGLTRRCNPHALRHGFAVGLLKSGATIAEICELMGHSNMATTHIYLSHVDPSSKVAAVNARPRPGAAPADEAEDQTATPLTPGAARERAEAAWAEQARAAAPWPATDAAPAADYEEEAA